MYIVPLSNLPTVQSGSAGETSAQSGGLPFREVMQQAVQSLQESQQAAAQDTYDLAYGNSADLHTIYDPLWPMESQQQVRNPFVQLNPPGAVSAYKEIMQMQI